MSNFFIGLADGLKTGYTIGQDMNERRDQRLLREGLVSTMGQPADPNTPTGIAEADQLGQMANLYAQYGDPDKAIDLRSKAAAAKAKAYQDDIERSYRRGDLPGLIGGYNRINNGTQAELREENGEMVIYHYPVGQPDAAQPWLRGDQQTLLQQVGQYLSPEMYQKLALEEIVFATKQQALRKARLEGDKLGMQIAGQPVSYGEQMRGLEHQRSVLNDQMSQMDANLKLAVCQRGSTSSPRRFRTRRPDMASLPRRWLASSPKSPRSTRRRSATTATRGASASSTGVVRLPTSASPRSRSWRCRPSSKSVSWRSSCDRTFTSLPKKVSVR